MIGNFVIARSAERNGMCRGVCVADNGDGTILVRWGDANGIANYRGVKDTATVVPDAELGSAERAFAEEIRRQLEKAVA